MVKSWCFQVLKRIISFLLLLARFFLRQECLLHLLLCIIASTRTTIRRLLILLNRRTLLLDRLDDFVSVIVLLLSLLLPIVAEPPIFKLGALLDQIDLADFHAPFGPDAHEFVHAARDVAVWLHIDPSDFVDAPLVSVSDHEDLY